MGQPPVRGALVSPIGLAWRRRSSVLKPRSWRLSLQVAHNMRSSSALAVLLAISSLAGPARAGNDAILAANAFAAVGDAVGHVAAFPGRSRKLAGPSVTCPPPSPGVLACNFGNSLAAYPVSGGICSCTCGATQQTAADSTAGGDAAFIPVAATSACTAAACTSAFSTFCPASRYVRAQYNDWAEGLATRMGSLLPLTPLSCGSAAMCYGMQLACNAGNIANGHCPPWMAGCTILNAGCWGANATLGGGAAAMCAAFATSYTLSITSGADVCVLNNCNALPVQAAASNASNASNATAAARSPSVAAWPSASCAGIAAVAIAAVLV